VPTTADAFTNFDGITYGKGGAVLKQLPYFIGEENFRQGIRNYLKRHAWGNTELDDFVSAMAEASDQDLTQWQQEWLFSSGVNTLQAQFTCENDQLTDLRLLQSAPALATADKLLRSQRTQVGLYRLQDDALEAIHALPVTYSGAVTSIPEAIGLPCPALVLPNEDDWAYFKIALDEVSQATLREHINAIANPTTRLMLWQALWDSVQDTVMPLDEFVDFVLATAANENDSNVLRHINSNLGAAFGYLAAFGGHEELRSEMERFLRERLAAATPGSEAQLIWLDAVLARSFSQNGLDYLHALLQGDATLEQVPIDQDRRWSIIRALNRYQYPEHDSLLAAEKLRDSSDSGINAAFAAEALRPDPAIKEAWLGTILENSESQKLATLRTVMAALFPPEQGELLEAVAERLLAAVPVLEASASQELLGEYTGYFGTGTCSEASVARLAAANARFAGMQPLVVKSYLIHHQGDERCLRMRQRME
jgi:aminopeptidase N